MEVREFFREPSGGKWLLAREPATGHIFIRHEAATISHIEISTFLRPGNRQPEHLAFRALLGALIETAPNTETI